MKKIIAIVLALLCAVSVAGCKPKYPYEAEYTELGIPLKDYYKTGGIERCVWDIEYLDGNLFVGSGDYDKNKGPVMMYRYNFEEQAWKLDNSVLDEQIERYFIFDDRLYAAGCDPQTSWSYGNFYYYEGTSWKTNNTIPGGIHNFDMVKFDGKIFVGLGVVDGDTPVKMTEDEKNWTPVYLYKDGKIRETHGAEYIRVYDFFVLRGELYAYFYTYYEDTAFREIYKYDGEKFVYYSDMIKNVKRANNMYAHINQKCEFNNKQYFSRGYLYQTEDMKTAERINVGDATSVSDMKVINDTLYILCNERINAEGEEDKFKVSVKRSKDGQEFEEMFYFDYPVRAISFTYVEKHFYFGMGYGVKAEKDYEQNGMVLSVKNPL